MAGLAMRRSWARSPIATSPEKKSVAAKASGDGGEAFSWANFNCVSAIFSSVAKFSFRRVSKRMRLSTEADGSSEGVDVAFLLVFFLGLAPVFKGTEAGSSNRAERLSMSSGERNDEDFLLDERVDLEAMA